MTPAEIADAKKCIDDMSQFEMASLRRFAPVGHPYFDRTNGDLPDYFEQKFKEKGGFTPGISKALEQITYTKD